MGFSAYQHLDTGVMGDNSINELRADYPGGLHFVVGDTHGEPATLAALMKKIRFDPGKDHVYFVGDYNAGNDVAGLLRYLSSCYREDYRIPGFHLIRGNHERELYPLYPLENMPDIIVLKGQYLDYYIVHAGMVSAALELIGREAACAPAGAVLAYRLTESAAGYDAPLRQIIWSRNGLYSQHSHWHAWPSQELLHRSHACILHGHTPFCMLKRGDVSLYGDKSLFWDKEHIWFSEDLQSFDLDSNMKGRYDPSDSYRGLACVCLEAVEEAAAMEYGELSVESVSAVRGCVFGQTLVNEYFPVGNGDTDIIFHARPEMKTISLDDEGRLNIEEL